MKIDKKKKLIQNDQDLYHTQDLAVLWGLENRDSLRTIISRYVKSGYLNRIHKGFYSTKPIKDIDPIKLGLTSLRRWAYLSTESVLVDEGVIFQELNYITLISDVSRKFTIADHNFRVRKMKEDFLYNETGIKDKRANIKRAVADLLYYSKNYHFDNPQKIDWKKVQIIKNKIGYNYDINR